MSSHFSTSEEKARYVRHTFAHIANRYDLANRFLSLGQDLRWRRLAATWALAFPPAKGMVLDVGTGTGDQALFLARGSPRLVVALDFSLPMMRLGRQKAQRAGVASGLQFLGGDALDLPFPDHTFDRLTSAFVLRNIANLPRGLAEMARVVKPGGCIVCLELSKPPGRIYPLLHRFYLRYLVPFIGQLITQDREAYRYLSRSIQEFPTPQELREAMERAGLRGVEYTLLTGGAAAIHRGYKGLPPLENMV